MMLLALALLAPADSLTFVLRDASGKNHSGAVFSLDDWNVQHGKGAGRRYPAGDWISLRRVGVALPELPSEDHLILANGDRIAVTDLRLDDEKLVFRQPALNNGKETSLPLSMTTLIWRIPPDREASGEKLRHRLLQAKRSRDVILLRNGDTVEGTLEQIKNGQVEIEVNKKIVPILWEAVSAIALSTELLDRLNPSGVHAHVVLTNGSRVTLTSATCDGESLVGKTLFNGSLEVPLAMVVRLDVSNEKVVPLSEQTPTRYEYFPYLDEKWSWSKNSNVLGGDFRLGGSSYDRGLGLRAGGRVTYSLQGKYQRFESLVGLDDREGKLGRVKLRILVDGKAIALDGSERLTHAEGPLAVQVPLDGAKELTLEVLTTEQGPVQAVVNWVDALLVK